MQLGWDEKFAEEDENSVWASTTQAANGHSTEAQQKTGNAHGSCAKRLGLETPIWEPDGKIIDKTLGMDKIPEEFRIEGEKNLSE